MPGPPPRTALGPASRVPIADGWFWNGTNCVEEDPDGVHLCPDGLVYDPAQRACVPFEELCSQVVAPAKPAPPNLVSKANDKIIVHSPDWESDVEQMRLWRDDLDEPSEEFPDAPLTVFDAQSEQFEDSAVRPRAHPRPGGRGGRRGAGTAPGGVRKANRSQSV